MRSLCPTLHLCPALPCTYRHGCLVTVTLTRFCSLHIKLSFVKTESLFLLIITDNQHNIINMVIFFPPFNHEKKWSVLQVTRHLESLVDIVVKHKPVRTQVIWIPNSAEFEEKRKSPKFVKKTYDGLLAADKIYILNKLLYTVLQPHLENSLSQMFGFVNLVNMSSSRLDWSTDGIHFDMPWYHNVVQGILSTLCHS